MQQNTPSTGASSFGKLVLIIGPSGVGKSVILKRLRAEHPELHIPKSATTREKRPGESEDLYHFVTDEEFDRLMEEEKFLEWAVVHGGARYGTLLEEIIPQLEQGIHVMREVDVQGFESIAKHASFFGENAPYSLVSIFILPESRDQLMQHITKRAPISDDELARRMESIDTELQYAEKCTHQVTNMEGKIDETMREIEAIIF